MSHIITRFWIGCGFAALLGLLLASTAASAQTPPPGATILSGFLTCPAGDGETRECPFRLHYVNLDQTKTYAIRMTSTEFHASLTVEDRFGSQLAWSADYLYELNGVIVFRPPVTGDYRLIATSAPPTHEGFYTITLRELPVVMRVEEALSPDDPVRDGRFLRTHELALIAGRRYIIDMESKDFDAYLTLLNSDGAIVAFNDEGYFAPMPTRIVYTPTRTGTYRVVTTSAAPFATGTFRLTVCVN